VYEERRACVPGAVVWWHTAGDESDGRVLPDGCVDLLWADGELMIAGPDTRAYSVTSRPGAVFAGVRFAPGCGPAVLGVRADDVRDTRVALADVAPTATVRRLTDRVALAREPASELERIAAEWHAAARAPDPAIKGIVSGLRAGATVASTATAVGLNERGMHRRCLPAFGYGPKTLARILRLQRALGLARSGMPFATVAITAGYADQAHLARDVKGLAGVPLSVLVPAATG
jgi:AraC-like DNA-binding protein